MVGVVEEIVALGLAGATVPFQPLSFAWAGAMPPTATVPTTRRPANHLATIRFSFMSDLVLCLGGLRGTPPGSSVGAPGGELLPNGPSGTCTARSCKTVILLTRDPRWSRVRRILGRISRTGRTARFPRLSDSGVLPSSLRSCASPARGSGGRDAWPGGSVGWSPGAAE